ncbi:Uncharacterised protein [Shigella sonnei]|nr:Uncharacterised protein [Shigella sonnei]
MPRIDIFRIVSRCGDKFGAVQYRTAANRQQESHFLFANQFHGVHQRFISRVWLNTAKFQHVHAFQGIQNLIENADFFHAAAAVGNQYASIVRNLFA